MVDVPDIGSADNADEIKRKMRLAELKTEIVALNEEKATQLARLETERAAIEKESVRYRQARMNELMSRAANAEATAAKYKEKANELEISAVRYRQQIEDMEASAVQLRQKIKEMEKNMEVATVEHKQEVQDLQNVVIELQKRETQREANMAQVRHRLGDIENKETKDERQRNGSDAAESVWKEWDSRVESLVRSSPHSRLPCAGFAWAWQQKFPDVKMEDLQPSKRIKRAVQWVTAVKVRQDDVIVLANDTPEAKEGKTDVEDRLVTLEDMVRQLCDKKNGGATGHVLGSRAEAYAKLAMPLAKDAWQLDPARNPAAKDQWRNFIKPCAIMSLRHTHNNVDARFGHGEHKGQLVSDCTDMLAKGMMQPNALTTMVAAQWDKEVYVVFGNRRLKALQDACSRGMRTRCVDCIVHDLSDNTLGELKAAFLCKFLSAMSTNNGGTAVDLRNQHSSGSGRSSSASSAAIGAPAQQHVIGKRSR